MSSFYLGEKSKGRLEGLHPDLISVVEKAIEITEIDFTVLEGLRNILRQQLLVEKGASKTMNSRHLTGHAVDLAPYLDGRVDWSWPLHHKLANTMKESASSLNIQLEWGGDWRTFKDGAHYQLPWASYPAKR